MGIHAVFITGVYDYYSVEYVNPTSQKLLSATNGKEDELLYVVADEGISDDGIDMKLYRANLETGAQIRMS
jgi:hypothetical protein